jgi:hypothetical protein
LPIAYLNKFCINFIHKEALVNYEGYSSLCTTTMKVEGKLKFLEAHEQLEYTDILTDLRRINLAKKLYNAKTKYLVL